MKRILTSAAVLLAAITLNAKIVLPPVIGDNMVLQQQTSAAIFGKAEPGKTVTVKTSWNKKKVSTTADSQTGKWLVRVQTPAAGGPYDITISDGEKIVLHDEGSYRSVFHHILHAEWELRLTAKAGCTPRPHPPP